MNSIEDYRTAIDHQLNDLDIAIVVIGTGKAKGNSDKETES